jgi:hypothetical protein
VYFKEEGQTDRTEDLDFKCSHNAMFSKCSFYVLGIKYVLFMQTHTHSHSTFNVSLKINVKTTAEQTEWLQFLAKEWVYNICHNDELQFTWHKTINMTRGGKYALSSNYTPTREKKKKNKNHLS